MVRTLTRLNNKIKSQEEEITQLKKEIETLKQQIENKNKENNRTLEICNSCPECKWRV